MSRGPDPELAEGEGKAEGFFVAEFILVRSQGLVRVSFRHSRVPYELSLELPVSLQFRHRHGFQDRNRQSHQQPSVNL